ncbi:MAG: hypothetical protein ACM3W4_01750 [Ignavibacteriales bacterium]
MAVAAAAAIAAAAAVSVAAAAFALYAALSPRVGEAWAAAIVAAVAAVLVLIAGLLARARAEGGQRRREAAPDASLVQKAVEMAREHPILATGVALGAGVYAIRNPKLVAAVVAAFMEGRNSKE